MQREQRPSRLEALDAWRGLCAVLVALEHLNIQSVLHDNRLIHNAYRFVDFFFVLSGFVIMHAYGDRLRSRGEVRTFLIRRVGRLWPLHFVMLALFIAFELGVLAAGHFGVSIGRAPFTERHTLESIPANLALIHSWGLLTYSTWNVPSWSISTEMLAYTMFSAVCAWFSARASNIVFTLLLLASLGVVLFIAPGGMTSTFDYGVFRCLFGFSAGALTRVVWARWPLRLGTTGELVTVIGVIGGVILLPSNASASAITLLFAFAVWIFASEDGAISISLRQPLFQKLGAWSYSIYMVHSLIALLLLAGSVVATKFLMPMFGRVDGVATIIGPAWMTETITFAYLGSVILLARTTYRHVELRGQRLFGRLVRSDAQ